MVFLTQNAKKISSYKGLFKLFKEKEVDVNDFHYTVVQPVEAAQSTARHPCMDPRPPCTALRLPCMGHGLPCMDPRLRLMAMVRLKQCLLFL